MTPSDNVVEVGSRERALQMVLDKFCRLFNQLDKGNLSQLPVVYGEDIQFQVPFGKVSGLDALTEFMAEAYRNVLLCQFPFGDPVIQQRSCIIPLVMEWRHKRINLERSVFVVGISNLEIRDGKVR